MQQGKSTGGTLPLVDNTCIINTNAKKNHITWEDVEIEKDLKCNLGIGRYMSPTGKKNHIKWDDVVRERGQVSQKK